jgi:hypothetical protein
VNHKGRFIPGRSDERRDVSRFFPGLRILAVRHSGKRREGMKMIQKESGVLCHSRVKNSSCPISACSRTERRVRQQILYDRVPDKPPFLFVPEMDMVNALFIVR